MKNKILFPALIVAACAFQACQNAKKNTNEADSLSQSMVDSSNMAVSDTSRNQQ